MQPGCFERRLTRQLNHQPQKQIAPAFSMSQCFGVIAYLYLKSRRPSSRFWQAAAKYPEAAYQWFTSENCWHIGESRPSDDWIGPFHLYVPSVGQMIRIYGRQPDFEQSQQDFLTKVKDHESKTV
jgi:hypothetical protein